MKIYSLVLDVQINAKENFFLSSMSAWLIFFQENPESKKRYAQ